jgi:hypothetical protein
MALPHPPSLLRFYNTQGRNYQLIEIARVLRVFFETGKFDRTARSEQAVTQFSARAYRAAQGSFGDQSDGGAVAEVDPIAGISAPPPQYRLRVATTISERTLEVPWISVDPSIQFVPEENDYVLVMFLSAFQGVAFGSYVHVSSATGSYRQGRIPLQRGEVAIAPRNKLQPGTTHLIMTNGGVVRLASSDGCALTMEPAGDQITLLSRNFRHFSGVHTLQIREKQSTFREGDLDLEVYNQSIVRSDLSGAVLGAAQDTIAGRQISIMRMGHTLFNRGVQIPGRALEDSVDPRRDALFLGLAEEIPLQSIQDLNAPLGSAVGNTDPAFTELRRLKSFFLFDNAGNGEWNAGNYTPVEIPIPEGQDEAPLEAPPLPDDIPVDSVDAKIRASRDVKLDALEDILLTALGALKTISAGATKGRALSYTFTAGASATPMTIEITEDGECRIYFGALDAGTGLAETEIRINGITKAITLKARNLVTEITIDDTTGTVQVKAPTLIRQESAIIELEAPLIRFGSVIPTGLQAGPAGGKLILDPIGGATLVNGTGTAIVTCLPTGEVDVIGAVKVFVDGPSIELGAGAISFLVKDTIIPLLDGHTHLTGPGAGLPTSASSGAPGFPVPTFGAGTLTTKAKGF